MMDNTASFTFPTSPGWKQSSIILSLLLPACYQLDTAYLSWHLIRFWQIYGLICVLCEPVIEFLSDIRRSICEKVCLQVHPSEQRAAIMLQLVMERESWEVKVSGRAVHGQSADGIKRDISGVCRGPAQQDLISGGFLDATCAYMVPSQYF